jgi:hypothetical protein
MLKHRSVPVVLQTERSPAIVDRLAAALDLIGFAESADR